RVWADWFAVSVDDPFPSELRVLLRGRQATASLTFSGAARPMHRVTRVFGTRSWLEVNLDAQTVRAERPSAMRGPFIPLQLSWAHFAEARRGRGLTAMRVFVTGGGGFLGRHVVSRLLMLGHDVTCLLRARTDADPLRAAAHTADGTLDVVRAALDRPNSYRDALDGCEVVV